MLIALPLVAAGAYLAADAARYASGAGSISGGGSPHGTITGSLMGFRHVIGFGLRNAHHPARVYTAWKAESDARKLEHKLFWNGVKRQGYDNGPDAFRHAYASALITTRLVRDAKMKPADAVALTREMGLEHERDSFLLGKHYVNSRDMDVRNNEAGMAIAVEQALWSASSLTHRQQEDALAGAILAGIRSGRTVVLDAPDTAPRASTARDIEKPTRIPTPQVAYVRRAPQDTPRTAPGAV